MLAGKLLFCTILLTRSLYRKAEKELRTERARTAIQLASLLSSAEEARVEATTLRAEGTELVWLWLLRQEGS